MNSQNTSDNNELTIETYRNGFDVYEERTPQQVGSEVDGWLKEFIAALPEHASIIEFGSATGRDARYLRDKGFSVLCTDVIPQALKRLESEGFITAYFDFRTDPPKEWQNKFDAFYANGVFVHATEDIFIKNIANVISILKPHGVLAFSLKSGEGEEVTNEKMDMPRYFKYYSEDRVKHILSQFPLELLSLTFTHKGKWMRYVVRKTS